MYEGNSKASERGMEGGREGEGNYTSFHQVTHSEVPEPSVYICIS